MKIGAISSVAESRVRDATSIMTPRNAARSSPVLPISRRRRSFALLCNASDPLTKAATAIRPEGEVLPVLEIVVNLQCQVDVVEEVTAPMVHDQRTRTIRFDHVAHVRGEDEGT